MHGDLLSEMPAESAALLDLGQNHAFGLIAGALASHRGELGRVAAENGLN